MRIIKSEFLGVFIVLWFSKALKFIWMDSKDWEHNTGLKYNINDFVFQQITQKG